MPHSGGLKNLSGTVGETTLSTEQMPAHWHEHGIQTSTVCPAWSRRGDDGIERTGWNNAMGSSTGYGGSTNDIGGSQPHTHSLSGASEEADDLPPYYSLAYIMRTS